MTAKPAEVRDRLSLLRIGDVALRASFAVSYDALAGGEDGADQARVYRLLGLPAGMTVLSLPAIARLAGQRSGPVSVALEDLTLTDAHLR
jgi:hypothetical protein